MRLEIGDNCCDTARKLIAEGLDGAEILEFCRGDIVSLRGRADAFAKLRVREDERVGTVFVRWEPLPPERKAILRHQRKCASALKRSALGR